MTARVRSSLGARLPRTETSPDEMSALRRRAWRKQGIAVIDLARLGDPWERQVVTNIAERLYGKRAPSGD